MLAVGLSFCLLAIYHKVKRDDGSRGPGKRQHNVVVKSMDSEWEILEVSTRLCYSEAV